MTPSTSRASIVILSIAALALVGVLGAAFYHIGVQEKETTTLLAEAEQKAAEETAFQSLRALQTRDKAELDAFDQAAFSEDKVVTVIESLERAGAALGVQVSVASVDKVDAQKKSAQPGLRLVVEADGSWRSVYLFLRAAESLPYKLSLEGVHLSREAGSWQGQFTLFFPTFN